MSNHLSLHRSRLFKIIDEIEDYAIVYLNKHGIVESWNRGAKKIIGYDPSEVIGKCFSILYTVQDKRKKLHEQSIYQASVCGKTSIDGWRVRKDGSQFWGNILLTAIHDGKKNVIGFTKVIRDLTFEKQSVEMLHKAEERYIKMVKEITDYAIILLDNDGNIQNWNDGAQKIKGYTATEAIGKSFEMFYLLEDRIKSLPETLLEEARKEGRVQHEGWRLRKDGTKFWGLVSITALHNDLQEVIGFSKVTRDLTEKLVAEKAQEQYLSELKTKNSALEQFSFIASHDLQEPLRTITNFTKLLQTNHKNEFSDKAQTYIDFVLSSTERMSKLIQSLLEYCLIGVNKLIDNVDCKKIVQDVKNDLCLLISESGAKINCIDLPVISGYPIELYLLFQNLIANAIKYRKPESPPEIYISSEQAEDSWLFTVADNGLGMDTKFMHKIFLIFQRLHGMEKYPGNGIGLANCKKIVELHGGNIWVKSEEGQGSIFYFTIPKQINFNLGNQKKSNNEI